MFLFSFYYQIDVNLETSQCLIIFKQYFLFYEILAYLRNFKKS